MRLEVDHVLQVKKDLEGGSHGLLVVLSGGFTLQRLFPNVGAMF
jgi:hypothetical protein